MDHPGLHTTDASPQQISILYYASPNVNPLPGDPPHRMISSVISPALPVLPFRLHSPIRPHSGGFQEFSCVT